MLIGRAVRPPIWQYLLSFNVTAVALVDELLRLPSASAAGTAIELMHFAYRAMIAKPDQVLAARGFTRVHHRVLYFVARSPETSVGRWG